MTPNPGGGGPMHSGFEVIRSSKSKEKARIKEKESEIRVLVEVEEVVLAVDHKETA